MKFNFNTIVFDLETTETEPRKIIEIGATFLDKELKTIDHYQDFVYTSEELSDYVKDLTTIKQEDVTKAPCFKDVMYTFERWVKKHSGNIKNCRLAAWGNYFDINILRDHYKNYKLEFPFSGTCIDVKTIALAYLAISGQRSDSCSVKSMAEHLNIVPNGNFHRADIDAHVTAKIYIELLNRISGGVWMDKKYIKVTF